MSSTEYGNLPFSGNGVASAVEVDFDYAKFMVRVPGFSKDEVEVFTVLDTVYVEPKNAGRQTFKLADGETVKETTLENGVLTILIDRPAKKQSIKVK